MPRAKKKSSSKSKETLEEEVTVEEVEVEEVQEEEMAPVEEEEEEEKKSGISFVSVATGSGDKPKKTPKRPLPLPREETRGFTRVEGIILGIDLGTYQTKFSASNGTRDQLLSVMGTPKDPISKKFIGKDVVFGEEVIKKKLALNIYRPVEELLFNPKDVDTQLLTDFLEEVKLKAIGDDDDEVHALLCHETPLTQEAPGRQQEDGRAGRPAASATVAAPAERIAGRPSGPARTGGRERPGA